MPTRPPCSVFVLQAAGMVSVQADCTLDEAVDLLSDWAMLNGHSRDEVASAVIERKIQFHP